MTFPSAGKYRVFVRRKDLGGTVEGALRTQRLVFVRDARDGRKAAPAFGRVWSFAFERRAALNARLAARFR